MHLFKTEISWTEFSAKIYADMNDVVHQTEKHFTSRNFFGNADFTHF